MRLHWLAVALLVALALLGCESLRPTAPSPDSATLPQQARAPLSPPSLRGKGAEGLGRREEPTPIATQHNEGLKPAVASAPADPDSLTLAADCLQRGDRATAAVHLEAYVCRHPEQIMFRAQLAELLLRVGRDDAAKIHYEQFIDDAQAATGAPRNHLVDAHTRLMEIGQRTDDRFAEVFHRGVGLLLLVKEHEKTADRDEGFSEEMLCKAIKALAEAKEMKPADPRVRVYLAEALDHSGNRRAADAERAATRGGFVPGGLTPTERKQVLLRE